MKHAQKFPVAIFATSVSLKLVSKKKAKISAKKIIFLTKPHGEIPVLLAE